MSTASKQKKTAPPPLQKRIKAFARLGEYLREHNDPALHKLIQQVYEANPWFLPAHTRTAFEAIGQMLQPNKLEQWLKNYALPEPNTPKRIGIVTAGNIPLVGFHDFLTVLITGHHAIVKLSSKDDKLLPFIARKLTEIEPKFKGHFEFPDKLQDFDGVIATGSNNSNRYFEYYFGKYPNLLRQSKGSAAVLTGEEDEAQLRQLGKDIFLYFGLGCRSISKLYVPERYDFEAFFNTLKPYAEVMDYRKYKHNYDFNLTMLIMNDIPHHHSDFLMAQEKKSVISPVGALHYETYTDENELKEKINKKAEVLQCVAVPSDKWARELTDLQTPSFGATQFPEPWEYADGKDTVKFLQQL